MTKTLIKNATVVTVDRALGCLSPCDVLIDGAHIADIRPNIAVSDAEIIEAARLIAMPGLINAHIHCWETMMRGAGAHWPEDAYFEIFLGMLGEHVRPDDIYVSTLLGALNQIDAGCTTMFEWLHCTNTPDHSDMSIQALDDAGVRAVFGHGAPKPNPRPGAPHFSEIPHAASEIKRLREGRFAANDDGLVSLAMGVLGPDYAGLEVNRRDFALARAFDLRTSAHVWGGDNRKTPGGYVTLVKEGWIDHRHNAVHANFFSDDEVKLLIDHGASITATPSIEVGVPKPPMITAVIKAGGRPSVAVDSEIDVSGDMFDAMKAASQLQAAFDAVAAYYPNAARESSGRPDIDGAVTAHEIVCTPHDVLEWATINNAAALGLASQVGSLTPGKKADIVLLRRDDLNLAPVTDPVQSLVFHANRSNVDTVFIDGKAVKRQGRLLIGPATFTALTERVAAAGQRLFDLADQLGRPLRPPHSGQAP